MATAPGVYTMVPMNLYQQQNFALFMQQQNAMAANGRHSAPTLPTPGVPRVAQLPPMNVPQPEGNVIRQEMGNQVAKVAKKKKNPAKQKASAQRKTKSGGKGTHFTQGEKEILLDCIDEVLPIGPGY